MGRKYLIAIHPSRPTCSTLPCVLPHWKETKHGTTLSALVRMMTHSGTTWSATILRSQAVTKIPSGTWQSFSEPPRRGCVLRFCVDVSAAVAHSVDPVGVVYGEK